MADHRRQVGSSQVLDKPLPDLLGSLVKEVVRCCDQLMETIDQRGRQRLRHSRCRHIPHATPTGNNVASLNWEWALVVFLNPYHTVCVRELHRAADGPSGSDQEVIDHVEVPAVLPTQGRSSPSLTKISPEELTGRGEPKRKKCLELPFPGRSGQTIGG